MERGQEWRARNEVGGCGMKLCCCCAHMSNITMVPEGIWSQWFIDAEALVISDVTMI